MLGSPPVGIGSHDLLAKILSPRLPLKSLSREPLTSLSSASLSERRAWVYFGEPIIQTQTAKLFGILFDRRLRHKDHMKYLVAKVYRQLNRSGEVAKRDKLGRQALYYSKSLQVFYTPCP